MADAKVRVNTLKFAFGRGSSEPTDAEMFEFCRQRQFNPEEIYSIHKEKDSMAIYVKFKSESFMKKVLHNMQAVLTFKYADGKSADVTVSEADISFKYIRVFNLPPEIEDREIYQSLSPYGIVKQQVRERYHPSTGFPVFSTVRGLYMEVTKEIPPQVRVRHFQARIYYEGMINKCFICKSADHIKANCPRRNATQNSSSVQGRLYSDIVEARDLRPSFAKRVEDKQLECQMTVLKKQSGAAESQQEPCGSGTDTVGLSGEAISVVDVPRVQPALVSEAQESSPRISASGSEQRELTEPVSDESTRQEEPFIEQKVKKRGRKKTRGERGESSNESESEPVIIVPASVSLLDAQQVRTRSRSKQPRIAQDPLSPPSTVHKKHNKASPSLTDSDNSLTTIPDPTLSKGSYRIASYEWIDNENERRLLIEEDKQRIAEAIGTPLNQLNFYHD